MKNSNKLRSVCEVNKKVYTKLCDHCEQGEDDEDKGLFVSPEDSNPLRVVGVYGQITEDVCASATFQMLSLAAKGLYLYKNEETGEEEVVKEPFEILVSSTGGIVEGTLGVYDMMQIIKRQGFEIITTAIGTCQSAATILLIGGTKRRATENCRFMIHNVIASFEGSYPAMKEHSAEITVLQDTYCRILLENSKLTERDLKKFLKVRNHYFSAQKALEYGIIDEII